MIANQYKVSFKGDKNVLELYSNGGYNLMNTPKTDLYTYKKWIMICELYINVLQRILVTTNNI